MVASEGTLAVAFRKHLVLDNEPEKLVDIGAESLKDVTLDNFRNPNPIEMEVGYAWKNNAGEQQFASVEFERLCQRL